MHALFAQADKIDIKIPKMDPQADQALSAGLGWFEAMFKLITGPIGIGVIVMSLVVLVLAIWVSVVLMQKGQTAMGVLALLGSIFCAPIGQLIALIGGWVKAGEYKVKGLMTAYTLALVIWLGLVGYFYYAIGQYTLDAAKQLKNIADDKAKGRMP